MNITKHVSKKAAPFFFKLIAAILIFLFSFPAQLFAQEQGLDGGAAASEISASIIEPQQPQQPDEPPVTPPSDGSIKPTHFDVAEIQPTDDELGPQPLTGDPGTTKIVDNTVRNTKTLGEADLSTGALSYSYDFPFPPGRNGLTPKVSAVYSSNNTANDSMVGYGWQLDIPSITRVNLRGSDSLYAYNDFTSSLSGDLVQVGSSTAFIAKTDTGESLKYFFQNNSWTVYDAQGTRYFFGTTTSARQDDPNNNARVYRWMLEEVRDTNDNFITYEYTKDDGQIYPDKITYTNHGSSEDGIFEILFELVGHNMGPEMFYADFPIETNYRIGSIEARENGEWVKKYYFYYGDDTTAHVLLTGLSESGRDLETDTVIDLGQTTFDYKAAGPITWSATSGGLWTLPTWFVQGSRPKLLQVRDVNGDAYPDVVYRQNDESQTCPDDMATWINDTHGSWTQDCNKWRAPRDLANDGDYAFYDNGVRMYDYNGDQLNDFVYSYTAPQTSVPVGGAAYKNTLDPTNDNTWPLTNFTTQPAFIFGASSHADNGTDIVDVNGDGIVDIVSGWLDDDNGHPLVLAEEVSIGDGTTYSTTTGSWHLPYGLIDENFSGTEMFTFAQFMDLNGDGLNDFIYEHEDTDIGQIVGINNGHDWTINSWPPVPIPTQSDDSSSSGRSDEGVRNFDVNGDGLSDFVHAKGSLTSPVTHVYLTDFQDENPFQDISGSGIYFPFAFAENNEASTNVALSDINADGMTDFLYAQKDGSVFTATTSLANGHPFTDMLVGIHTPEGASSTIQYKMSTKYFDSNNDLMNPQLPIAVKTVSTITTSDGNGNNMTESYAYADGRYYFASSTDRKFSGFGRVEKTDAVGNISKTYFHQGNESATTTGEYVDHISKAGKPYRIEQYDSAGNLYSKTINKWDRADLGSGASFVKLVDTVELTYDGDSDHKEKATSYAYNNSTGKMTQAVEWGEVTGSNDGTFSDTGSDKFTTSISYATSSGSGVPYFYLSSQETTVDQSSVKVRETKNYYDTQSFGSITKGNLTKQELWKTGSTYIDTEKTHNSYGLVTQEKDPRDKATAYTYDSYNLYPATTTNALSHVTTAQYDYSSGKPKQIKDANGYVFQTVFDPLDRVKEEKQPDLASPSTLVTKSTYQYNDSSLPRMVHKTDYLNSATSTDSYSYTDGFGRVIQRRVEAEDANTFVVTDKKYNSTGQVLKESLPYFGSGASSTAATTTSALFINYTYDPIYRVKTVSNAVGSTTNTYDDWKLTVTDPNGEIKYLYKDAYDNLNKVEEINGGSTYTTTYEYDGNKNLTKITDALGNIRNFTYDGLGRRLTAEDLHASGDSYFGKWFYEYDNSGNLASTTDPMSHNVVYTYDDVNRPLTENYTGQAGTEVTNEYDSCAAGVGRLCVASSTSVKINFEYFANGATKREVKTIGGAQYATNYTYDRLGNPITAWHADDSITTNEYNSAGQLERIFWKEGYNDANQMIVADLDYGPTGRVSYQENGNGTETTSTFDANHVYRLTNKETTYEGAPPTYTIQIYPSAADGQISYTTTSGSSWATAHNATSGTAICNTCDGPAAFAGSSEASFATDLFNINRGFYPFNTSVIPSNATVTSATLNIYATPTSFVNSDNDGSDFVAAVLSFQSSTSTLSSGDYDSLGSIEGSNRLDFGSLALNSYNAITLNATGTSWIKKNGQSSSCGVSTGWTCFGTREGHDLLDSAITTNTANLVYGMFSETTGTSNDPYLEVMYQLPATSTIALQDIDYTYDSVGNITNLTEHASTSAYRTVAYQYDDLHRLTRASSTKATSNYLETYAYNAIGSLTNKSDVGSYLYLGTTTSNFANPHAATSINGATLTYDNSGNLLNYGGQTHTWNYKNQLTGTAGTATTSATYDASGERVTYTDSSGTTIYVNNLFDTQGDVYTKHIYANGELVATIESKPQESMLETGEEGVQGGQTQDCCAIPIPYEHNIYYIHTDHLGGTNVVTGQDASTQEVLDFAPFGKVRIDNVTGAFSESRKYLSEEYDSDTSLSYLNARYMNGGVGQFLSEDPVFLAVGSPDLKQKANMELEQYLADPQVLNSYSYARNNPLKYVDKDGNQVILAIPGAEIGSIAGPVGAVVGGIAGGVVGIIIGSKIINWVTGHSLSNTTGSINIRSGIAPEGILPPVSDPGTIQIGPASRPSEQAKGGKSYWDAEGGEWRYHPEDKWHNPHWDHNPHKEGVLKDGRPGNEWQNVPIGEKPPLKPEAKSKTNNIKSKKQ